MPITEFLRTNAARYPDEVALVEINPTDRPAAPQAWREFQLIEPARADSYRRTLTWAQFDRVANQVAHMLQAHGVKPGEKVAILLMNCLEWLPLYFGVLRAGAIVVPMNYRYTAEEIQYCLELADVSLLVFGPEFTTRIEQVLPKLRVREFFFVGEPRPAFAGSLSEADSFPAAPPALPLRDEDDAAIYFSSGTTGFPKAILHTHAALVSSCLTEQHHHGQCHEDVFLCIPPLYHTGAKMHWFGSLLSGSRAVLLRGVRPEWILQTVSAEHVTIVWLLVPWAQDILDAIERGELKPEQYRLSQWRLMHIGAQPVPPSLVKRWLTCFPHHQYDTNYGLSESIGPGCVHLGVENIDHVGAIGKAGYLWQTKIIDEQGAPVKQGQVGELAVKGPGVMKEYYKNPEATAAILKEDGWLLTGDMAREDEQGFIYLVDRKKDVIISGGENIYPVQIEDFLRAHPHIKDVAVIGLPESRLGEITAAIISCKDGCSLTEAEVQSFCEGLPRYKRPRKVIFAEVPRNPTGKIEKPKLREIYCGVRLVEAQTTK
ncbi:MAG: class I adenylate-forming enzyme family protein [Eubacteriales bacterium]